MTPFLARLMEIPLNSATIPSAWKKTIMVRSYKRGAIDRPAVTNCRPISLAFVVCKQLERVIAEYLRQVWDKNDWLYEGHSCESQVITVCQDIVDYLDEGSV